MSFSKPQVRFPLNFTLSFSVMTHNCSEVFSLKHYILWTKGAHQSTILQTFQYSDESSPNFSCHFWNHRITVYSNFVSLFSVMKDNSSVFFWLKPCTLWTKRAHQSKIFRVLSGWVTKLLTKFLLSYLKSKISFFETLHHPSVSWEITLLYIFSWNFISFGKKEPIKVQNFTLLAAHVEFQQIYTLIL